MSRPDQIRKGVVSHYRRLAPLYGLVEPLLKPLRRRIAENLAGRGPILDVACGRGTQVGMLLGTGRFVAGIDLSRAMLRRAPEALRRGGASALVEGDGTALPFRGATFGASVITLALHEMPPETAVATLREMARVTKSGGIIMAADLSARLPAWVRFVMALIEPTAFAEYGKSGLDDRIRAAGLLVMSRVACYWKTVEIVLCRAGGED